MRLLAAAARAWAPWRNGGGLTSEVAAGPGNAGPDDFGWRVSIARIDRDGPFSAFSGVDRALILLDGGPVTLTGPDWRGTLATPRERLAFAGEDAVEAAIGAPATVLNLMARRGRWICPRENGTVRLILALAPLSTGGINLRPLDAVLLDTGEAAPVLDAAAAIRFAFSPA